MGFLVSFDLKSSNDSWHPLVEWFDDTSRVLDKASIIATKPNK